MGKILHLIETGGPGGAENVLIRLARAAPAHDLTAEVGLVREGWLAETLRQSGIETLMLPDPGRLDLGWIFRVARIIKDRGINAIHAHEFAMNCAGAMLSRVARLPFVATVHGCNYYPDKLRRRLAYRAIAASGRMVAVSENTRDFLARTLPAPAERIHVIPNGLDLDDYAPDAMARAEIRDELRLTQDDVLIGAIGNLYPVKGHCHLLAALGELVQQGQDKIHVMIAGRGGEQAALEAQAAELGLSARVHLLGFRQDIPALLQAMDIFAMPSLSEGLPLSILEAMASRRPVVASRVGGIPEAIVDDQSGLLVPAADPAALRLALARLIESPDLRSSLALTAHERASTRYSLESMYQSYIALYGIGS